MGTDLYELHSHQITRKQGGLYWYIHLNSGGWLMLTTEYADGRACVTVFVDNNPRPHVLWKISDDTHYSAEIYTAT